MAGILTNIKPVFSYNSKYICFSEGSNLRIYLVVPSVDARLCLNGHKTIISGIVPSKANVLQVYSSSLDGDIILWDIDDGSQLMKKSLGGINLLTILGSHKRELLYAVSYKDAKLTIYTLDMKDLESNKELISINLEEQPSDFQINIVESYIGFISTIKNNTKLYLINLDSITYKSYEQPSRIKITTYCFDNEDTNTLYVGDDVGKITHYSHKEKLEELSRPLHWHDYKVNCLSLPEGSNYLYSGGDKPVVAVWSLDTTKPTFISHLSGNVLYFSVSPDLSCYAVTCSDNTINLSNPVRSKKLKSIEGIIFDNIVPENPPVTGFHYSNLTKNYCFSGLPNTLQFFSFEDSKIVCQIKISTQLIENKDHIFHSEIKKICFSPNGDSLVTLESTKFYQILKFWIFNPHQKIFDCVTEAPQGVKKDIVNIIHHPNRDLVLETDKSGNIKVWTRQIETEPSSDSYSISWVSALLRNYKSNEECFASAFSKDGSILAVMMRNEITLWETGGFTLLKTIPCNIQKQKMGSFGFLADTPYIVGHIINEAGSFIYVWDVMRCTELWTYSFKKEGKLSLKNIFIDPVYTKFIALCSLKPNINDTLFFCFDALSPNPVSFSVFSGQDIQSIIFLPPNHYIQKNTSQTDQSIFKLQEKQKLGYFAEKEILSKFVCFNSRFEFLTDTVSYSKLFKYRASSDPLNLTQKQITNQNSQQKNVPVQPSNQSFMQDTPSHVVPPVHTIYESFMKNILMKVIKSDDSNVNTSSSVSDSNSISNNNSPTFTPNSQSSVDEVPEDLESKNKEITTISNVDSFVSFFSELQIN
eukprot:TRINITY_DN4371_c0_g1_i1.p1 TRINITY_DN4371_c0_g1~~TRINITY_DN4371_c0_g1_i1.p1  ORF type:complete len:826 (-),score=205.77 TRINITY_DN4371_c0_g1_i1:25-2463(-)